MTPDLLGGAQTTTIAKVVQTLFLSGRDWPQGAALGFILMAVTIIGTFAAIRSLRTRGPVADADRAATGCCPPTPSLVYVFLFVPIVILIIFSFNARQAELQLDRVHPRLVPDAVRATSSSSARSG